LLKCPNAVKALQCLQATEALGGPTMAVDTAMATGIWQSKESHGESRSAHRLCHDVSSNHSRSNNHIHALSLGLNCNRRR
jgi:hypothetical protein